MSDRIIMRAAGDVRDEFASLHADRVPPTGLPVGVPSPNLAKCIEQVESPWFQGLLRTAEIAENGGEVGGEIALDIVYEKLPKLLDMVQDLVEMCHRREAAASAKGITFGRG